VDIKTSKPENKLLIVYLCAAYFQRNSPQQKDSDNFEKKGIFIAE